MAKSPTISIERLERCLRIAARAVVDHGEENIEIVYVLQRALEDARKGDPIAYARAILAASHTREGGLKAM